MERSWFKKSRIYAWMVFLCLLSAAHGKFPSPAGAAGFSCFNHGAKELGMHNNAISHTMGPASNYYNPALLTELEGTQAEIGTSFTFGPRKFKSAQTSQVYESKKRIDYPSTIYITHKFNNKFAAGIGINNTFGNGVEWGNAWEGRYIVTKSEMAAYNINPNFGAKINDKLSLAVGFNYLLANTKVERNIDFSTYGLNDGQMKLDLNGDGCGYNLGLLFRPVHNWSFGAAYRSKIVLDMDDGTVDFTLPSAPPQVSPILQSLFPNTGVKTSINLPSQVYGGVSYHGIDNLIIEAGIRWEEWSQYKTSSITFDEPINGEKKMISPKNCKNALSYSIGGKFDINKKLALVGGYRHEENPIPEDTFEPAVMGNDKESFSLGTIAQFGNLGFNASYLYEIYQPRTIEDTSLSPLTPKGKYEGTANVIIVSFNYTF